MHREDIQSIDRIESCQSYENRMRIPASITLRGVHLRVCSAGHGDDYPANLYLLANAYSYEMLML
jgi:hypothetical protein